MPDDLVTDIEIIERSRVLRDDFIERYNEKDSKLCHEFMAKLLKHPNKDCSFLNGVSYKTLDGEIMHCGMRQDTVNLLEALNGPHGWAVYQMLMIKMELGPSQEMLEVKKQSA